MGAADAVEKLLVGRWIAGDSIDDAIARAKKLNARGIAAIINYLGEEFTQKQDVDNAVGTYLSLIGEIKENEVRADVSLKLTQLGLWMSEKTAAKNYSEIVSFAKRHGIFVWIDMETSRDVDATIRIYKKHIAKGNVGITIQSALKRSGRDIEGIVAAGGVVRLVKGAYPEPASVGYTTRSAVTRNYETLMSYLFRHGRRFVIATHDKRMLDRAVKLDAQYSRDVEYAMLSGVRNNLLLRMAQEGRNVRIYVPFGSRWVGYSYRRLREASNAKLVLRSLLEYEKV